MYALLAVLGNANWSRLSRRIVVHARLPDLLNFRWPHFRRRGSFRIGVGSIRMTSNDCASRQQSGGSCERKLVRRNGEERRWQLRGVEACHDANDRGHTNRRARGQQESAESTFSHSPPVRTEGRASSGEWSIAFMRLIGSNGRDRAVGPITRRGKSSCQVL